MVETSYTDTQQLLKLLERNLAIANGKNVGSAVDTTFDEHLDYFESKRISVDTSILFGSISIGRVPRP